MTKQSYLITHDKQDPLVQHPVFGRIHTRDYAFYMRKLAFMQQPQKNTADKKDNDHHHNNG